MNFAPISFIHIDFVHGHTSLDRFIRNGQNSGPRYFVRHLVRKPRVRCIVARNPDPVKAGEPRKRSYRNYLMTAPQPIRLNTMRTPQHSAAKDALNLTSRHACGTLLKTSLP
jgi:hypothetical protein